jgi:hypothetical protein
VYSTRIDIPPGATATFVLHLDGSVRLGAGAGYRLAVGHQPLVSDDHLTLRVRSTDDRIGVRTAELLAPGGQVLPVGTEPDGAAADLTQQTDLALHVGFHHG